jgi:hypothetical protein
MHMLETIKQTFSDARAIEIWTVVIALLSLLLISIQFLWQVADRRKKRNRSKARQKELEQRLATLRPLEANEYARFILEGQQPSTESAQSLEGKPSLIERDSLRGWRVADEYSEYCPELLKKWAKQHERK